MNAKLGSFASNWQRQLHEKTQSIELYAGCNGTYRCMSWGNAPSSGGIWPLIELLFIWLQLENIHENMQEGGKEFVPREEATYKCLTVFKFANDLGSGPDIWFMSSWNLVMLGRLPSSSGKGPDIWFPLKSLRIENGIVTICHAIYDPCLYYSCPQGDLLLSNFTKQKLDQSWSPVLVRWM